MSSYKPNANEAAWIRELAAILDETGLSEIEIEKSDVRVRVARGGATIAYSAPPVGVAAPHAARAMNDAPASLPAPTSRTEGAITSPMVGTVYLAAAPGGVPFVKVGDKVAQGQTLVIVEAMKTMNPIPSPRSGTVRQILVRDAQPIEFGEPLIVVE